MEKLGHPAIFPSKLSVILIGRTYLVGLILVLLIIASTHPNAFGVYQQQGETGAKRLIGHLAAEHASLVSMYLGKHILI